MQFRFRCFCNGPLVVKLQSQGKRMRCGFCQPASEQDSSLRNERPSFRNDEPRQTTNWKNLPTCVAPGSKVHPTAGSVLLSVVGARPPPDAV